MTLMLEQGTRIGLLRIRVLDDLDIASVAYVRERLDEALALTPERLIVDLCACGFVDSQALNLFEDLQRAADLAGVRLTLAGCSAGALRLLAVAGLSATFELEPA